MTESKNLLGCQVFNPRNVPSGWSLEPLRGRIELAYGRALPEERRRDGNVVVYGSNGPVGRHSEFFVPAPGVLVGRKGTVGAVHYAESDFWPIDTVYFVRPLKGDDLGFLHYLLQYLPLGQLNAATGVPGLSRRDAYALNGVFPLSMSEQQLIAKILRKIDQEITHVCGDSINQRVLKVSIFADDEGADLNGSVPSYARALIDLKRTLMDEIFTGKLSVSSLAHNAGRPL